jgi:WD40 repeat protein
MAWVEAAEEQPFVVKLAVRRDPAGKVKGLWRGRVTGEGLLLRQKGSPDGQVRVGDPARYVGGNRLEVRWEGRDVELTVAEFVLYQHSLARDLCRFLHGEIPPPQKRNYAIPAALYVPALLPLGIPILSLGGALWAGLGGALCAACFAILRKEEWSAAVRVVLSLLFSVVGYTLLGEFVLLTYLQQWLSSAKPGPVAVTPAPAPQPPFQQNLPPPGQAEIPQWVPQAAPPNVPPPPPPKKPGELRTLKLKSDEAWRSGEVWHVRFSPDGKTLATLGNEGFCQMWDRDTGEQRGSFRLENKNHNNWLVFSPTGEHLVAWDGVGMIYLREGATGKLVTRLDPGGWDAGYNYGDFSPDGKTLVVKRGGFIFFWKVPEGDPIPPKVKELTPIQTHNTSSQYAADGKTIVVGAYGNRDGPLQRVDRVIDLTGEKPQRRLRGFDPNNIWARLTLSPDRRLAMLHTDKIVELLDWATDKHALLLETKDSPFAYVAFTPDSKALVTLQLDGWVRLWEIPSGKELGGFDARRPNVALRTVSVSPDGKLLATGGGDEVTLWDFATVFPRK